jgi:hypothetical protein
MKAILYTGFLVLLWAIDLLNGTGLGEAYRTTELARIAALVISLILLYRDTYRRRGCYVPMRYFLVGLPLLAVFILVSQFNGYDWIALDYLWVFLLVYILSHTRPNRQTLYLVGIAYAILGLAILYIFNYADALSGWNENSIAMIGLFSYLVFTIPFYGAQDWKSIFMLLLVGGAYTALIWPTDSRSCIIAIVFSWLVVFHLLPLEKIFSSRSMLLLSLQVPLVIALLGCLIAQNADVAVLDAWSLSELGKPFFNGRDTVWLEAFRNLKNHWLLGTGYIDSGTYHNSAVACLVAYGAAGYSLWIMLFHVILKEALPYRRNICAGGALSAFLIIFWQQSVELGIFSTAPSLIPYIILGLMLGRVRGLKEEACRKSA